MTLIEELRRAIMAMTVPFCSDDFYHIAEKHGKCRAAVAKAVRQLRDNKMIRPIGHRGTDHATRDMVCYEVIPGAKFVPKDRKKCAPIKKKNEIQCVKEYDCEKHHPNDHWWKKVAAHPTMIAQNNLDAAMMSWRN